MSSCSNPRQPSPSPQARFLQACYDFADISPSDDIPAAFDQVRVLLLEVASGASQPNIYALAISTLNFAQADLIELEATGSVDALERIKEKVSASVGLLS